MFSSRSRRCLSAFAVFLAVAGCNVKVNTGTGPTTNNAGAVPEAGGDPAEQASIQVVKNHGGHVTQDNAAPNKPVIAVNVFRDTFTDADLKALAAFTKVRKISLSNTKVTGAGFAALTGLKDLTDLDVPQNPINDAGLKEIASLGRLKILNVRATKITAAGLRELTPLKDLVELHVANNFSMTDAAGVNIAASLPRLEKLYIDNSSIGDAGVIELAKMPKLKVITLNGTKITDAGLSALAKLSTLEELQLSFDITDASAKIIAGCKSLRALRLFSTKITDKGLQELGTLPNLKELELRRCPGVTNEAITAFIKAHPNCSVKQ